jgi:hypothetical protein
VDGIRLVCKICFIYFFNPVLNNLRLLGKLHILFALSFVSLFFHIDWSLYLIIRKIFLFILLSFNFTFIQIMITEALKVNNLQNNNSINQ